MDDSEIKRIARKIFLISQAGAATAIPFTTYLVILIADLASDQLMTALTPVPVLAVVFGSLGPYLMMSRMVRTALRVNAHEPAEARISRILKLPRRLEMFILGTYSLGAATFALWIALMTGKSLLIVPWAGLVFAALMALVLVWTRIYMERLLMPLALESFASNPHMQLREGGLLWPKQRWYLPYAFALFVTSTLVTTGTVLVRVSLTQYDALMRTLDSQAGQLVRQSTEKLLGSLWIPMVALGVFMLLSAAFSALLMARHQHDGFRAIQDSIQGFVNGAPTSPKWITTDEIGDLARVTAQAFDNLREFSLSLRSTATSLGSSAGVLNQSNTAHSEVLSRQAAAIQEAQVTAQEIRETSRLAAEKADGVLHQTTAIEKLGVDSETAVTHGISLLEEIRSQVDEMASRIKTLGEHTRQIENITRAVKSLADQSNMLALNAAIEAVRSGEHGKGFGVVAREIRSLADQSIRATSRVTQILEDISASIQSTVVMTEKGSERVAASVAQVRAFGDNTRKLSGIMQDNTQAVRQISIAVNQQNAGIAQIFQAINELNTSMTETMARVSKSSTVTAEVETVATEVSRLISDYGWEENASSSDSTSRPRAKTTARRPNPVRTAGRVHK